MGRWAYYRGISQRLLDALVAEPRLVLGLLALGRPSAEERRAQAAERLAHLPDERRDEALRTLRTFESLRECFPAEVKREAWGLGLLRKAGFSDRDLQAEVNIEKRWDSLRNLLDDPRLPTRLGYAVTGGTEIGEDLGYGPVRYVTSDQVLVAWHGLSTLGANETALVVPDDDPIGYYSEALETVRGAYREAAACGFAMLLRFG